MGYHTGHMALTHPLDSEVRRRVRTANLNQAETAKRIGRSQAWLNKYMHGAGHATIDDVFRLVAVLLGVASDPKMTEMERRLLRLVKQIPAENQEYAVRAFEQLARVGRRQPQPESDGPTAQTPHRTSSTAHGRHRDGGRKGGTK